MNYVKRLQAQNLFDLSV